MALVDASERMARGVSRHVVVLIVVAAAFAGCAAPASSPKDPEVGLPPQSDIVTVPEPDSASISRPTFGSCQQFHTAFSALAQDIEPLLPEGFTLKTDEAGLAQLQVIANACETGPGNSLWVRVPVQPPAHWDVAGASHYIVLEAYLQDEAFTWAQQASMPLVESCQCSVESMPAGALLADTFTSDGEEDDYKMRVALVGDTGEFPDYRSYLYFAVEGKAVARMLESGASSQNRGLGSVALEYVGPGAAPTVFPGVAHVVQSLAMEWTFESLEVP